MKVVLFLLVLMNAVCLAGRHNIKMKDGRMLTGVQILAKNSRRYPSALKVQNYKGQIEWIDYAGISSVKTNKQKFKEDLFAAKVEDPSKTEQKSTQEFQHILYPTRVQVHCRMTGWKYEKIGFYSSKYLNHSRTATYQIDCSSKEAGKVYLRFYMLTKPNGIKRLYVRSKSDSVILKRGNGRINEGYCTKAISCPVGLAKIKGWVLYVVDKDGDVLGMKESASGMAKKIKIAKAGL